MPSKRRTEQLKKRTQRRAQRKASQLKPGEKSRYARKKEYCDKHGVWGFEVPTPKPWGGGP